MGGIPTMLGARSQRKGYDIEAQQVGMEAKASELERREMLQDALAMQAVITGAGGRAAGEGSPLAIRKADIARAGEDIAMIKAGGKAKAASLRATGRRAEQTSMLKGLFEAGTTAYAFSQIGGAKVTSTGPKLARASDRLY
jgi:hypothetical protein